MYTKCNDPSVRMGLCPSVRWGKDYPDATTFAEPLFGDSAIGPDSCCNYALVGAPNSVLEEFDYTVNSIPAVDAKIDECDELQGSERLDCWIEFDRMVTEEIVPWVPYLMENEVDITSARLVNYTLDQFAGHMALDKVSLAR